MIVSVSYCGALRPLLARALSTIVRWLALVLGLPSAHPLLLLEQMPRWRWRRWRRRRHAHRLSAPGSRPWTAGPAHAQGHFHECSRRLGVLRHVARPALLLRGCRGPLRRHLLHGMGVHVGQLLVLVVVALLVLVLLVQGQLLIDHV